MNETETLLDAQERSEIRTKLWSENEETMPLEKPSGRQWDSIKMDAEVVEGEGVTRFIWCMIQSNGGLL